MVANTAIYFSWTIYLILSDIFLSYLSRPGESNPEPLLYKSTALPIELGRQSGAQGGIRTPEGISRLIYSQPRLTASVPALLILPFFLFVAAVK